MARRIEQHRDDESVLAEHLGQEVIRVMGTGNFDINHPLTIEMNRPLAHAPQWKELLVIYKESPNVYVLTKGTQAVRGEEPEGFQMKLEHTESGWKFVTRVQDNVFYGFEIFAFLKSANAIAESSSSATPPTRELK